MSLARFAQEFGSLAHWWQNDLMSEHGLYIEQRCLYFYGLLYMTEIIHRHHLSARTLSYDRPSNLLSLPSIQSQPVQTP